MERAATTNSVHVPPLRVQPVAATEAVSRLCRIALGTPLNGQLDIAGPEIHLLDELARQVLTATGDHRPIVVDSNNMRYLDAHLDADSDALLPRWRPGQKPFRDWLDTQRFSTASARDGPAA